MDRVNVDTDQIIPKQFLKRIERTGFGQFLFNDWRFNDDGTPDAGFVLNQPGYEGASILATGRNFGSGSSREHAPWALLDYGFRCILAPSFADIFQKNCFENGLVPVLLPEDVIGRIISNAAAQPGYRLTVDLADGTVSDGGGLDVAFKVHDDPEVNAFRRHCLLNGLDDIGMTLQHEDKIAAYEKGSRVGGLG
jgi:3-isopropylmalate/(R)-2-methylmalate dehydratase small subunit